MASPEVTVLMPVYNGESFLKEAIESILGQTFADFELLAINDGSTDATADILSAYSDPRLRVIDNDRNLGLISTLNRGLDISSGEYVARMDADDIASSRRIEIQRNYLRTHPGVGLCGSWFRTIGDVKQRIVRPPSKPSAVAAHAFFYCPIAHPTVMIQSAALKKFSLRYDASALHAEDYDLWVRAGRCFQLANIPKVLLKYRVHKTQISSSMTTTQGEASGRIRLSQLSRLVPGATAEQKAWHLKVCDYSIPKDIASLARSREWLDVLLEENDKQREFDISAFRGALNRVWYELCLRVAREKPRASRIYFSRMYAGLSPEALSLHAKQLLRGIVRL